MSNIEKYISLKDFLDRKKLLAVRDGCDCEEQDTHHSR
jgi:hypothetical protein